MLLDESFHIALATAAANEVAVDLLRQVNERIRLVRMHDFLIQQRIDATIDEHLNLVELVLAGDIVNAEAAFTQHLGDSMAVVEERVRVRHRPHAHRRHDLMDDVLDDPPARPRCSRRSGSPSASARWSPTTPST